MSSNIITDALRKSQFDASSYAAVNFSSDTLQALMVNTTGDSVADATKQGYVDESDFNSNEVTGTGYTARGMAPGGQAVTQSSHAVKVTCSNPQWTTATITAYGVWFVSHKSTAATSPALFFFTFGGAVTSTAGTFQITVNASGLFIVSGG